MSDSNNTVSEKADTSATLLHLKDAKQPQRKYTGTRLYPLSFTSEIAYLHRFHSGPMHDSALHRTGSGWLDFFVGHASVRADEQRGCDVSFSGHIENTIPVTQQLHKQEWFL